MSATVPARDSAGGVYVARLGGLVVTRGRGVTAADRLRELWRFRHMLGHLASRNLKVKYKRSALGFLWTLLNPLATVLVLVAVFRIVVRLPIEHYWAFLLSGYFAWNTAAQSLFSASTILPEHARLTRSVAFPKEVLVLAALVARFVELAAELAILVVVLAVFHHGTVPAAFALVPVLVVVEALLVVGLMLPIAVLSTLFRDVTQGLPVLLTTLFYLSPVFYPASMVPEAFRGIYAANPFASLLACFHRVLYDGSPPPIPELALAAGIALVVAAGGFLVFGRYSEVCAEIA